MAVTQERCGLIGGGPRGLAVLLLLVAAAGVSAAPTNSGSEGAWRQYNETVDSTRQAMLSRPEAAHAIVRAQALYALQAVQAGAFRMIVAPRRNYPNLYREEIWGPYESTWGGPASDFVYQWTFLDGRHSYRLRGKRGTTRVADMQLWNNYWSGTQRNLGNYDIDAFEIAADGSFEVILSADEHPGNWIQLDTSARNIVVQIRDAFWNWETEKRMHLWLECIDCGSPQMALNEAEMNRRLIAAGKFIRQAAYEMSMWYFDLVKTRAGGANRFIAPPNRNQDNADAGASPRALYYPMIFQITPGQAIIIESEVPQAKYWSLQLTDIWWQTLDFTFHQSGLNGHQMQIDPDGKFRAVISLTDPGVPNWIDPVGSPTGQLFFRTYDAEPTPLPTVTVVDLERLRDYLPESTPAVGAGARAEALKQRSKASLERWGN